MTTSTEYAAETQPWLTPFITGDLPGIGGEIRHRATEFKVTEIPLYEPSGNGDHVYLNFTKRNQTTWRVVGLIADRFSISSKEIGVAGLKDSLAETTQTISLPDLPMDKVERLKIEDVKVNWVRRHNNKLKMGHLKGNRFSILIRNVSAEDAWTKAQAIAERLREQGGSNGFGHQRFGNRATNHLLGRALLEKRHRDAVDIMLGQPGIPDKNALMGEARKAFSEGKLSDALSFVPEGYGTERAMLESLISGSPEKMAIKRIRKELARLCIHAAQSWIYNRCLSQRIVDGTFGTLRAGDLAMKHINGAFFLVEDPDAEQPRADTMEVSPTGPVLGYKGRSPEGYEAELEQAVFQEVGIDPERFRRTFKGLTFRGERRAFRIPLNDLTLKQDEKGIRATFSLPRGSYATTVIREFTRRDG